MSQWQGLARNYFDAWQEMARHATGQPPALPNLPWHEGFEQWSRMFSAGGGAQNETIERIVDSAKTYATFMQSALSAATSGQGAAPWAELMGQQGFGIPGMGPAAFENPMLRALREMPKSGMDAFAPFMNAGAMAMPRIDAKLPGELGDLKAWLNLPAFGLMREHQEHYQKMMVAWVDYQEQLARYNALMLKASQRGFELFEGKLIEREQPGRQIDSLRALYDLWVDAAEEGYAEVALSGEFREVYGALVNAQMRVRSQIQQETERVATELGMPTRSELNSIGERLQALRREVRQRGQADDLAREIADLRSEFAALKASVGAAPRRSAVVERTVEPQVEDDAKPVAPVAAPARTRRAAKPKTAAAPKRAAAAKAPSPRRSRSAPGPSAGEQPAPKPKRSPRRAVAAAGSFASRIAKFADASLGAPQGRLTSKPSKAKKARKSKKARRA